MCSRYLSDLKMRKSKIIHVYRNGDQYSRAALILLRPLEQKELDRIFKAIEEKITLPSQKPIKRIYTIDGDEVEKAWQIEDQSYYVVGSTENFVKTNYGTARYWTILGPVRWSKFTGVNYEPPEHRDLPTSRSTYDQWKVRVSNSARPSSKMTKSMSVFPTERKLSKKDKKLNLSVGEIRRPVSEPSNDIDHEISRDYSKSKEKGDSLECSNDIPKTIPYNSTQQMDDFLDDTVKLSTEENDFGKKETKNNRQTKEIDYDIVDNIEDLTPRSDISDRKNLLIVGKSENDEEDSLNQMDEEITDECINKFKEREEDAISDEDSEECSNISDDGSLLNESEGKNNEKEVGDKNFDTVRREEVNDDSIQFKNKELEKDNSLKDKNLEDDEESENSLYEKEKAALLIQANFRGNMKKRFGKTEIKIEQKVDTDLKTKEKAATVIQANFRGHLVRDSLKNSSKKSNTSMSDYEPDRSTCSENEKSNELEEDLAAKEKAATVIQSNFRGHLVRENMKNFEGQHDKDMVNKEDIQEEEKAAIVIQSNFRGHLVRENLKNSADQYEKDISNKEDFDEEEKAAIIIQSNFRGHLVREGLMHSSNMEHEKLNSDAQDDSNLSEEEMQTQENEALIIQTNCQGQLVREDTKTLSEQFLEEMSDEELNHRFESDEEISGENLDLKEKSAIVIQSNFRGHLVRKDLKHPPENSNLSNEDISIDDLKKEEKAATIIQSNFRGHLVREAMKKSQEHGDTNSTSEHDPNDKDEDEDTKEKERAAILIQSNFRGFLTRSGLKSSSNVIDNYEDEDEEDRSYAVHDSDDDEDEMNYSPAKNSKYDVSANEMSQFNNTYADDPFAPNNKG